MLKLHSHTLLDQRIMTEEISVNFLSLIVFHIFVTKEQSTKELTIAIHYIYSVQYFYTKHI